LQLLEQQLRGSNITVKQAMKQAKFEKENGSFTVELFNSDESTLFFPQSLSAAKSTVSSKKKRCKSLKEEDLPPSWRRELKSTGKHYIYVHISSGVIVDQPRIMLRVLELLKGRKQKLSVKEAVRLAREEEKMR